MTPEEFLAQYQCKFSVSERDQELYKRVEQYFTETDKAGFHISVQASKRLKKWAELNEFSPEELKRARRIVDQYLPDQH